MFHRRLTMISLALMMTLASATAASAAAPTFSDIAGHWANSDINTATSQGLAGGYPDGTFRPNDSMSRAEFVKVAALSRGLAPTRGSGGFADLEHHWLNDQGYIEPAVRAGVIVPSDYGNPPHFNPNQSISRREVAVIAARVLGRQGANWSLRGAPLPYADAPTIPYWASGSVAVVRSAGVLSGYPDRLFGGERTITRAEAVVAANRLMAKRDQVEVPVWEGNSWRVDSPAMPFAAASAPSHVAAAPDGTVYYQMGSDVWHVPAGGAPRLFYRHQTDQLSGIAATADGLFVAERGRIWKVTAGGEALPWAGGAVPGDKDGQGETAGFNYIQSLCTGASGELFAVESSPGRIRRISADRQVRTLTTPGQSQPVDGPAGQATVYMPGSCTVDHAGNVYFADFYPGRAVRKLATDGGISWVAGYRPWWGYADGTKAEARFGNITGLAVDDWGNIWVADQFNQRIRRVSPDGHVYTVAGSGYQPEANWLAGGNVDGPGTEARFDHPSGIALTGGKLYISQNVGVPLRVITGNRSGYTGENVVGLVPVAFGNQAERYDPLPLPGEFPALPVALYTPVTDVALKADGAVVYESGPDQGGRVAPALSPLWKGQRPGTYQLTVSAGLPDGRRLESLPVTGKAN